MQLKGDCDTNCQKTEVSTTSGATGTVTITASVGLGGVNRADDVKKIQTLLNGVRPDRGGPVPKLVVDGLCGPLTRNAIRKFQAFLQLPVQDSRVDPDGPTLMALNSERMNSTAPSMPLLRHAIRLFRAINASSDARAAVKRAIAVTESALHYKMIGPGLTQSPDAYQFVSQHFKFDGVSDNRAVDDLTYIRAIYRRMETVLRGVPGVTGTQIYGSNLHDIDPTPEQTPAMWKAYVPVADEGPYLSTRIYWTDNIDGHPQDRYTYLLLHELAHFVDNIEPTLQIVDHGYLALGTVFALDHHRRVRNADNYSMMAFHRAFGKARLQAMYPYAARLND